MEVKNQLYIGLIIAFLLLPSFSTGDYSRQTCIDNDTLNTTLVIKVNANNIIVTENQTCFYGCVNNACEGSNITGDMMSMWMVYGTGTILLILGTVLGIPFGKFAKLEKDVSGKEIGKKPFNTTVVVKYIFFFVGLFLVYLSLGMARRIGTVYGSEGNITSAIGTSTMVMMITIMLFLFIFVAEFLFYVIKMMVEKKKIEEWGDREL